MASPPSREHARGLPIGAIDDIDALASAVDGLDGATGELLLAGAAGERGVVFVERGRICWAAARGLSRRLGDLLAHGAGLDRSAMESHYRHCKEASVPLGEHLVARGIVTPATLGEALRQHTVESLRAMTTSPAMANFVARSRGGYASGFTFAPVELLVADNARSEARLAHALGEHLTRHRDQVLWAAGFVRGGRAAPTAVALSEATEVAVRPTVRTLDAVSSWAASALDIGEALHGGPAMISCVDGQGTISFALGAGEGFVAGVAYDRPSLALIFADAAHARRARGAA